MCEPTGRGHERMRAGPAQVQPVTDTLKNPMTRHPHPLRRDAPETTAPPSVLATHDRNPSAPGTA